MASYVVEGIVVPISVGGHPAIDFCNTRAGWGAATPKEYLHTHAHLSIWARENGLVAAAAVARLSRVAAADASVAAQVVRRAVRLRSALYAVLVGPATRANWAMVNDEIRDAATASSLVPGVHETDAAGGQPARWAITDESRVDLPLLAVAWSAAVLLTSAAGGQVGACPGVGCGWLFANPRGRRRWCSMAWCGNRDKVRRHTERIRNAGRGERARPDQTACGIGPPPIHEIRGSSLFGTA